jgi:hypothetical protein
MGICIGGVSNVQSLLLARVRHWVNRKAAEAPSSHQSQTCRLESAVTESRCGEGLSNRSCAWGGCSMAAHATECASGLCSRLSKLPVGHLPMEMAPLFKLQARQPSVWEPEEATEHAARAST